MKKIRTVYVDMDGVLVDYDGEMKSRNLTGKELKVIQGAYRTMKPFPGAIEAIRKIEALGFYVHLATKIPDEIPGRNLYAATEKLFWVEEHIPDKVTHMTITSDKGQLGDEDDFIIDDRLHKAKLYKFKGTTLHFGVDEKFKTWDMVVKYFEDLVNSEAQAT